MSKRVPASMLARLSLRCLIEGEPVRGRRPWRSGEAGDAAVPGGGAGGGEP